MTAGKGGITPMMAQFLDIKAEYPDALLFYRMGDFYEMFFDDAVAAAEALDIALTKRGKHLGQDIPMCGVPVHSSENYLLTLIRKGYRVAVCEQLEDPAEAKKRGSKSVVKRGVVRLVTPGTLTEDSLLNARRHNYLCAFAQVRDATALAWVDMSTGDFHVQATARVSLGHLLARLSPKEVLISDRGADDLSTVITESGAAPTALSPSAFDSTNGERRLCDLFGVKSLDGFGQFDRAELSAMGAVVSYLEITQRGKLPLLRTPGQEAEQATVQIDAATRRNLELTRSLSGERGGSLLHCVDRTATGAGARLLERRLTSPSTRVAELNDRLDSVTHFTDDAAAREALRDLLRQVPDIDRALPRLSLERGGPRDLASLRDGLKQANAIARRLKGSDLPPLLASCATELTGHDGIVTLLERAIVAEPPLLARDGGFVAKGYDSDLDEARELRDEGRKVISALQADYVKQTGINALKIKHNNVLGYFIETPATHAKKMLGDDHSDKFIHRQTTANAVRFTTRDLSEMETRILNAGGRALGIETGIFADLVAQVMAVADQIGAASRALAEIDLATCFADLAHGEGWVRPHLSEDHRFRIVGGRHPVVEAALKRDGSGGFVANDCDLSKDGDEARPLWLLTGPNMAGKSTFLRQNALIALLAQSGSYVPAEQAEIGIVTQLFSRVGAADDLARGRSTFMVEMVETAAILNQAGPGALVILDEIGRGTATYDGLSIAWATLEHLHDVNACRTLFATHYHELTGLAAKLPGLTNATVAVREWEGEIIFLHEVVAGAADCSYGVQVARLAGLPATVTDRARTVLEALEKGDREGTGRAEDLLDELPLFSAIQAAAPVRAAAKHSAVQDRLASVFPDELTPREALALIYELKDIAEGTAGDG